tara:strand:- start:1230 stop:1928 length:699 start_codon:yes stop_codon:yes gene_type:complete
MGNSYGNRSIVLDNLKFNADPANKQSYPGSGTILYDTISLEGSSNQDAFGDISGATFNANYAGFFRYDGNDKITFAEGIDLLAGAQYVTTDAWFNSTNQSTGTIFCYNNTDGNQIFQLMRTDNESQLIYRWYNEGLIEVTIDNIIDEEATWFNIAIVHEGGNLNIFKNGKLFSQGSGGESLSTAEPAKFHIGTQNGFNRFWDGDISCVKVYSDTLSSDEIFQNYSALKPRFE